MDNKGRERGRHLRFGIKVVHSRDFGGMESRITWEGELGRPGNSLDRKV
jgi:hypothetical protein